VNQVGDDWFLWVFFYRVLSLSSLQYDFVTLYWKFRRSLAGALVIRDGGACLLAAAFGTLVSGAACSEQRPPADYFISAQIRVNCSSELLEQAQTELMLCLHCRCELLVLTWSLMEAPRTAQALHLLFVMVPVMQLLYRCKA
jgi:hypothetical protein